MSELGFAHVFEPPAALSTGERPLRSATLLLLHGTGGDEHDLLPVGRMIAPAACLLSPRGQVLERGMPRFFRRLREGVFDEDDIRRRAADLARFVAVAAEHYRFDPARVVAAGFSNGANIATSLLLLAPGTRAGAILVRAMVPLVPSTPPSLPGTPVLLSNGRMDPLVPAAETDRLASSLRDAGAEVTLAWQVGGHELTDTDVEIAREWIRRHAPRIAPTAAQDASR